MIFFRDAALRRAGEHCSDPIRSGTEPPGLGQPTHPTRGARFAKRGNNLPTETTWRTAERLFPGVSCVSEFEYLDITEDDFIREDCLDPFTEGASHGNIAFENPKLKRQLWQSLQRLQHLYRWESNSGGRLRPVPRR